MLREGKTLTEATEQLARGWGMQARLLPVTDDRLRTILETDIGTLRFQEYFVKHRWQPAVRAIHLEGADSARLTPQVQEALARADAIILCPSNPFVSIGPMLRVAPLRDILRQSSAPVVAVSPIVGGQAVKGPAAAMFTDLGQTPSSLAVAQHYAAFLDAILIDQRDAHEAPAICALGLQVALTDTLMTDAPSRLHVADAALALAASLRK
jgi:LPPG:FO 2-phospho-L-lactate transferase